jgi:hypothetical protein
MTIDLDKIRLTTPQPGHDDSSDDIKVLIKEARRRQRLRYLAVFLAALIVVAAALGVSALRGGPNTPRGATKRSPSRTPALPTGRVVALDEAGSLAVGRSGVLYVAAPDEHRILARLADGKFRDVAGTGLSGYSGNGGKAIDAKLTDPTGLTFNARGDLYFVDSGRVRMIGTNGVIESVAGDGSSSWPNNSRPSASVANQTPALRASFHSVPSIAFGPSGTLYIATDTQLLRMTRDGRLDTIRTHRVSFGKVDGLPISLDEGIDTLAVAKNGGIYVSGFNGWGIWYVAPGGAATYVGNDRGSGGTFPDLANGPKGAVYAEYGASITRVTRKGFVPIDSFVKVDGEYFAATYFAFSPRGHLYVDELPGNSGFEERQQLISDRAGKIKVLWTESKSTAENGSR